MSIKSEWVSILKGLLTIRISKKCLYFYQTFLKTYTEEPKIYDHPQF